MHYKINPSKLTGSITIPPSKSHTLRAILFASLAHGNSIIRHYLPSPDTTAMIHACQLLGATIEIEAHQLTIRGTNGQPHTPNNIIDAGNSGQVLRFIAALSALTPGYTVITGDQSIRTNRPIQPLLDGLTGLHVFAESTQQNGTAPIMIKGPLLGGKTTLNGEDSQPVSGLLMAAAFAKQKTIIEVIHPGETPWIDLTLSWFKKLNIPYQQRDYTYYEMMGNAQYDGFDYTVPGDFSSCAFPLAAALITQSDILLKNLDMTDVQGDKALIAALQAMGAKIEVTENNVLRIHPVDTLGGQTMNVNHIIDAVPILAVIACFAEQDVILTGAAIARQKESDRLAAIRCELNKMQANITELADGLIIKPSRLQGACVSSHNDHRIAMALAIAGLAAQGETVVEDIDCVNKSYPQFAQAFQQLNAAIYEYDPHRL